MNDGNDLAELGVAFQPPTESDDNSLVTMPGLVDIADAVLSPEELQNMASLRRMYRFARLARKQTGNTPISEEEDKKIIDDIGLNTELGSHLNILYSALASWAYWLPESEVPRQYLSKSNDGQAARSKLFLDKKKWLDTALSRYENTNLHDPKIHIMKDRTSKSAILDDHLDLYLPPNALPHVYSDILTCYPNKKLIESALSSPEKDLPNGYINYELRGRNVPFAENFYPSETNPRTFLHLPVAVDSRTLVTVVGSETVEKDDFSHHVDEVHLFFDPQNNRS